MARVRVQVNTRFKEFNAEFETAVRGALKVAGEAAAARSREVGTSYNIGSIIGTIKPSRVYATRKGFAVFTYADDYRQIFFEKGTYSRRRANLKQDRRSTSTQQGVKAGYFLRKGLKGADEVIDATRLFLR